MADREAELLNQLKVELRESDLVKFRKGVVQSWDPATGTNLIRVGGADIPNVPTLIGSDSLVLQPGDVVGLLRTHTSYFVVGRVSSPGGFAGFVIPVTMTPMFEPTRVSGTVGLANLDGALVYRLPASELFGGMHLVWEGRLCASSGRIRVDGFWGPIAPATQTITYELRVGVPEVTVGTWAVGGATVAGPAPELATFNVADRVGQEFVRVVIRAQSSVNNADQVACHLLALYQ